MDHSYSKDKLQGRGTNSPTDLPLQCTSRVNRINTDHMVCKVNVYFQFIMELLKEEELVFFFTLTEEMRYFVNFHRYSAQSQRAASVSMLSNFVRKNCPISFHMFFGNPHKFYLVWRDTVSALCTDYKRSFILSYHSHLTTDSLIYLHLSVFFEILHVPDSVNFVYPHRLRPA